MSATVRYLLGGEPPPGYTVENTNEGWGAVTDCLTTALMRARQESAWVTTPVVVRSQNGAVLATFVEGDAV